MNVQFSIVSIWVGVDSVIICDKKTSHRIGWDRARCLVRCRSWLLTHDCWPAKLTVCVRSAMKDLIHTSIESWMPKTNRSWTSSCANLTSAFYWKLNFVVQYCVIIYHQLHLLPYLSWLYTTHIYTKISVNISKVRGRRRTVRRFRQFKNRYSLQLMTNYDVSHITYRVGQIKWHHFTFLLVTHECMHKILWFLAHINYIMQKMRRWDICHYVNSFSPEGALNMSTFYLHYSSFTFS